MFAVFWLQVLLTLQIWKLDKFVVMEYVVKQAIAVACINLVQQVVLANWQMLKRFLH